MIRRQIFDCQASQTTPKKRYDASRLPTLVSLLVSASSLRRKEVKETVREGRGGGCPDGGVRKMSGKKEQKGEGGGKEEKGMKYSAFLNVGRAINLRLY